MPVITVMTYNIRHGEGNEGKVDLERIAEVINGADPDVIVLQEVDVNWKRSGNKNQVRILARALRMNYRFGPAMVRGRAQFGNAVLSRLDELSYTNHPLPSRREDRGMLEVCYDFAGQLICVLALHLGVIAEERRIHLDYILRHVAGTDLPLLMAGDFNMKPLDPEIKRITRILYDCCRAAGREVNTFPSANPSSRIDYIFCSRHWQVKEVKTISSPASDHLPLVAQLEL